ncbi:hypothetical protein AYI70_g11951 [Smittium culicis]|uniref:Letm1 RBD domain-containing protein n=1 Tax=Smittium culicis TaxID=133412 RepID=A0A1R1WZK2_9FUNG|nr:hypothetical protein AYI70_g11951 [Smittium culicis]
MASKRDFLRAQVNGHILDLVKGTISQHDFLTSAKASATFAKFPDTFALSQIKDIKTAKLMCSFFGLSKIGTFSMLIQRLVAHFEFIRNDDLLLNKVDFNSLTSVQIIEACDVRGIPTSNFSLPHLKNSLKGWVQFSCSFKSMEPGQLLWTRIFLLAKVPSA